MNLLASDGASEVVYSFEVGTRSLPFLSDHGFQGMTVVPGSMYLELALRVHNDHFHALVGVVGPVEFLSPIILPQQPITLSVTASWVDSHRVRYVFRETDAKELSGSEQPCAVVEIECDTKEQHIEGTRWPLVKTVQQRPEFAADAKVFYERLRENGNEYGPHFQTLRHVWRNADEAAGLLRARPDKYRALNRNLDPVVLDGLTQLLASFFLDRNQTFILQGIDEIHVFRYDFPEQIGIYGNLRSHGNAADHEHIGDLDAFDESGAELLRLRGVRFTYLDRLQPPADTESSKNKIVIASTFTAEPIEDSLKFWHDYLGFRTEISFAPYNQVFQELLSPHSRFLANQDGFNVILLNLADWVTHGDYPTLKNDPATVAVCFAGHHRYSLPNGIEVAHLNQYETEYVYKEIFEDRCYLRHGIRLSETANVIDIGANIGLFSLFVRSCCPHASIYAFEPSPIAFRALKANCEAYGPGLYPFNRGVSERRGTATLTCYEKSSVFSTFHAVTDEDKRTIHSVVANMVRDQLGGTSEPVDGYVDELVKDRLSSKCFECSVISVSDIIRDNGLQRVDLLKVDAEKSELEILRGIDDDLWPCIDQVVVEVHDRTRRRVDEVQAILTKNGFYCVVEEERLLSGSGLYNVYATKNPTQEVSPVLAELHAKAEQFVDALDSFTRLTEATTILCLCPPGKSSRISNEALVSLERQVISRARQFPRLLAIGSETILERYPASQFYDSHSAQEGHVPYTPEGFAALGTAVFRTVTCVTRTPYKVIVLDCDNTLWQGACGEAGPLDVLVTPAQRLLQEFMTRQMNAGMLLCLCSKNNEDDVWPVFELNPGMILKREHLAAWRINWAPKSENLRALAAGLNLAPESFVFLDDDPVECAEVRLNFPQALTLLLPADPVHLARFLDHTWAFDHLRVTEEDLTRTRKMAENARRETYRGQVASLRDFIDGLQLQVNLFEPSRDQLGRASQLTLRTNQFNFTAIRRSESELMRFLEPEKGHALSASVSDRFGDYGLVGLLLYTVGPESYEVDTFLLSCRALGRGVEHRILSQFGRQALNHGKQSIHFQFRHTDKNQAAWDFIRSVGADFMSAIEGGASIRFPAETLANLNYDPDLPWPGSASVSENRVTFAGRSRCATDSTCTGLSEQFQRIANDFSSVADIYSAIETFRSRAVARPQSIAEEQSPATLMGKMLGIWRRVLGNPLIRINDNFVEVGGTSLKAVQIVAAIRRELKVHLSIVNIFECPNVRLLCEKLDPAQAASPVEDAIQRGAKRKQRMRRRLEP